MEIALFFTFGAQKTCFFALFLPLQNRVEGSPTNRATGAFFRDEKGLEFCEKPPIFASESEKVGIFHVFACLEGEMRFQGSPPLSTENGGFPQYFTFLSPTIVCALHANPFHYFTFTFHVT